jgi:hypothetical protein
MIKRTNMQIWWSYYMFSWNINFLKILYMITKNSVEKCRNEIENSKKFSTRFYSLQNRDISLWYTSKIESSQKFKSRLDLTNSLKSIDWVSKVFLISKRCSSKNIWLHLEKIFQRFATIEFCKNVHFCKALVLMIRLKNTKTLSKKLKIIEHVNVATFQN